MDTHQVIIGSGPKSRFAREAKDSQTKATAQAKSLRTSRPTRKPKPAYETVDIYLKGSNDLVAEAGLMDMIRFSTVASTAFPKQTEKAAASKEGEKKVLVLGLTDVAQQPHRDSISQCLQWMKANKHKKHGERLSEFTAVNSNEASLTHLVDLYAAALAVGMRPYPGALRTQVMDRLTNGRPLQGDVQFLWEHLPASDGIIKRMAMAYFEHRENKKYTDSEAATVVAYVENADGLNRRFYDVQQRRRHFHGTHLDSRREYAGPGSGGRQRGGHEQKGGDEAKPSTKKDVYEEEDQQADASGRSGAARPKSARWQEAEATAAKAAKTYAKRTVKDGE